MKVLIFTISLLFLFLSCSTKDEIHKQINKQEQIYQSEKAFKELERER